MFTSQRVRYATSLTASTKEQIIAKLREEVFYLLSHPNDVLETTLLVLPFAMRNFEDWYSFTVELEEVVLPKILRDIRKKSTFQKKVKSNQQVSEGRLAQRLLRKKEMMETNSPVEQESGDKVEEDELQLACFHPNFMWSSEDKEDDENIFEFNHPMHFEKRAPFPTINILRSKQIYDFANQVIE